ncbi:MAG: hypothetical protein LBB40_05010 [Holophagales bacterium]|nr:hypothetical protein [Holophagales bacterium]
MSIPVVTYFFDCSIAHHLAEQSSHVSIAESNDVDKVTDFRLTVFFKKRYDGAFPIG